MIYNWINSKSEQQTELMYQDDTIWTAVFKADKDAVENLIVADPDVIYERRCCW